MIWFEPIALRLNISEASREIDLSVIPLRMGSRYNDWIELAGEAQLDAVALSPHKEALFMASFAVDSQSEPFKMADMQSRSMLPGIAANPLAWVGESFSVFFDEAPFWQKMAASEDAEDYVKANLATLPLGIRISSKSTIRLALFLTGLRSFSEQAAPGLLLWEPREHEGQPYVVINTTERAPLGDMEIRIHYAALPILNEWRALHPEQDPVALHTKYFHEQITCPGGQGYQWNEQLRSMESVAFGTPATPRGAATTPPILKNWSHAKAALSFEDDGLRLKATLSH